MHQKELNVVRFSMIVLFSALMIIYLLLYQIKGDSIVTQLSGIQETIGNSEEEISEETSEETLQTSGNEEDELGMFNEEESLLEETSQTGNQNKIDIKESDSLFDYSGTNLTGDTTKDKIIVLSGTNLRYGRVDVVEKLGISYQYALKDQKDIYFVFIDPKKYNFEDIIRKVGGTTYTMTTEKEIIENKLFGDKVTFINLPEYKEKKVVLLIEQDNALWLLQINYPIYHNSKSYLKNLFIE